MKSLKRSIYVSLCTLLCLLISNCGYGQQTLTQINGWNAYVHLPANYNNTTTTYPTIIFFPGLGEVGTNAASVIANGPGAYITQGWNGNVIIDGNTVEFIVISIQPPSAYPNELMVNEKILRIKSLYRVNRNKIYLTGLSHGGWCSTTFVTGDAYGGPYNYASQIAAVAEVEGVIPDDNSPYPNLFDNYALSGGKLLGFEQIYDNRGMPTRVNRMNATKPGSAIYVQTNFGGGGHCCWASFYGGQGTLPSNFMLEGVNQNLYQWLARQTLGTAINQAPVANAGADKYISLPVATTSLDGSGTDTDGIIVSYLWTKISGPVSGSLTNISSAQATAASLVQGVYQYQLKITDNSGNSNSDLMLVTVNAATNIIPTANAGIDQTITLPNDTIILNGSGADIDGTIAAYQWSKISGPASGSFSSTLAPNSLFKNLTQGLYLLELAVIDNNGGVGKDTVQVTVNAAIVIGLLPAVNPANIVNGLDYKYYEGSWSLLPVFTNLVPIKSGVTSNFNLSLANRTVQYGFSFTGYVNVPTDGIYKFYTSSDDGSNLYIDNVLTVANDGLHGVIENVGSIGLKAGKHIITGLFFQQGGGQEFVVSYEGMSIIKQIIPANALYRINNFPVANAGLNQTIFLPIDSVTLNGSGTDSDGSIASTLWTKISGSGGSISTPQAVATSVTGLTQGTYQFQLIVIDNSGAIATAITQVIVTSKVSKIVRVNLYGGSNPFTDTKWNNWNINGGINSSNFLYEDKTTSTIKASLGGDLMIVDNGSNYATSTTIIPGNVLRYNSASSSQRNLIIKGLNPSKRYSFEFYASRKNNGNKTVYAIGNIKDTVNTDNNISDFAKFADIASDNTGSLTINISRIGTWNYLAGFNIIEQFEAASSISAKGSSNPISEPAKKILQGEAIVEMGVNAVSIYPNPFTGSFKVQINNKTDGDYVLKLSATSGQTVFYKKINKLAGNAVVTINISNIPTGTYVLQIISLATGNQTIHKVIKN